MIDDFSTLIDGGDAKRHGCEMLLAETGVVHLLRESLSPDESLHALVEISVRRLVAAHYPSHERQYITEIQVI